MLLFNKTKEISTFYYLIFSQTFSIPSADALIFMSTSNNVDVRE